MVVEWRRCVLGRNFGLGPAAPADHRMLDVVLGPLWVFLAFGEQPGPLAMIGGGLVMGALIWRLAPEIGRARGRAMVG